MSGEPSFFEIGAPDARKAGAFYRRLFGWKMHPMGDDGSGWAETSGVRGGLHGGDESARIEIYFAVTDIDAAVATVRELGGEAGDPGPDEPGFGRFSSCRDDQGIPFGLHQPSAG